MKRAVWEGIGGGCACWPVSEGGTWPNGHAENIGVMCTLSCRAANRADGLSSPARLAVTSHNLRLVHKGASYQSRAQLPSLVSSWRLTSHVNVGVSL